MKGLRKTYGFTLCFLSVGLVWLFLDVKVPQTNRKDASLLVDKLKDNNKLKFNVENTSKHLREFSFGNKPSTQDKYHRTFRVHPLTSSQVPPPPQRSLPNAIPRSNTHILAVVSYMRSGSTLTADILQHFPATTYVFEPLHMITLRILRHKPVFYLNGSVRRFTPQNITDEFITEEIHKWFECRYYELDIHSLADNFHRAYSRSMKKLAKCWEPKRHTLKSMRECLPEIVDMCLKARHRLFKFIRLPMRVLKRIFALYPNLQIINLLRDPRGSLASQIKVKKYVWEHVPMIAKQHCNRVVDDLNSTIYLHNNHPNRAKILLYEQFAVDPIGVAKRIYSYTKLPAVAAHIRYISKLTREGRRDSTHFGIIRGNSSKTAFSWRDNINFTNVQIIDGYCQTVYDLLGYRPFKFAEEVSDHSIDPLHATNSSIFI